MQNDKTVIQDAPRALPLTRDLLAKMKKKDMKQAIFERFSGHREAVKSRVAVLAGKLSPYWQPLDEEC